MPKCDPDMKSTVLLLVTLLLLVTTASRPADGRRVGTDLLLAAVGLVGGPWAGPNRCIARDNDPATLKWGYGHMHLWDCNPNIEDQRTRWDYEPQTGYQIALGDRSDLANLCFDIPAGDIQPGRRVRLYKCNGTPAQSFQPSIIYEHLKDRYPYFVLMVNSNRRLCLAAAPGNNYNGRHLYLEACENWTGRHFWLFMGADGAYYRPSFPRMAVPESGKRPEFPQAGLGPMHLVRVSRGQGPQATPASVNAILARE
ncbi:hypothetical protein BCR44DRAFT_40127 [Catenaria anguillulae PL171]|uniref:Uncharacterized protein n=1 Tax=Catenaria anguillulae PL171 TaxID=765915 RepID=A0A1Y2HQY0_9FUNG|nr:hypothetical protein BCR44DRAFT_40127 [Catenaria anguillulae PL171]